MKLSVCFVLAVVVSTAVYSRPMPAVPTIPPTTSTEIPPTAILETTIPSVTFPSTKTTVPTTASTSAEEFFDLDAKESADHVFIRGAIAQGPVLLCQYGGMRDHSGRCKPIWG